MYVMQDIQEVCLIVNRDFLRSSLEEHSYTLIFLIKIFCITDIQPSKEQA